MLRIKQIVTILVIIINALAGTAYAADSQEIASITVLADPTLSLPLAELASTFSHHTLISVAVVFGDSVAQKKKIEDGDTGDVFITANAEQIQQLKVRGMVDINTIGPVADAKDEHFIAAVIASENMTPAREFLRFIKSGEAKKIFVKNGLVAP
jgi:ABC-type molybdate transport system substrate-binding protein